MSNNKAKQGAAIYLNNVSLSADNYIRSTTFEGNVCDT